MVNHDSHHLKIPIITYITHLHWTLRVAFQVSHLNTKIQPLCSTCANTSERDIINFGMLIESLQSWSYGTGAVNLERGMFLPPDTSGINGVANNHTNESEIQN